jgi:hypothetical protein
MTNLTTVLRVSVLAVFGLAVGCDQSKPELDKTKQTLAQVTSERESLKAQLEQSEAKVAGLQQRISTLEAAAKPATPDEAKGGKSKKTAAHKKPAKRRKK